MIEHLGKSANKKKQRTWTLHPGEILREEYLKPMHITPYRLAHELHIPVPRINDIVLEKRAISADTAVRLAKFFGTTESFWLGMQADYDAHQAKKCLQKELEKINQLGHVNAGRHFSRDEMNER
jgi:addiction module HigA family antidote